MNGASVIYGSATELQAALDYDFIEEKKFSYKYLSMNEIILHLAAFISRLWQIHVFEEGNTRTTAVFFIKYLRIRLDLMQKTISLPKMPGISEMHLYAQIIMI